MTVKLSAEQICRPSDSSKFDFETTSELQPQTKIIGQPRGTSAIDFGINIDSPGYNIFVMGESGTGRMTAIRRFIEGRAALHPVPPDWVYVHNFSQPQFPIAIELPPGIGRSLRDQVEQLIDELQKDIPRAFASEAYRDEVHAIEQSVNTERDSELSELQAKVRDAGGALIIAPEGPQIIPAKEGKPLTPEQFTALPKDEKEKWRAVARDLERELENSLRRLREHEGEARNSIQDLVRKVANSVVSVAFEPIKEIHADHEELCNYLSAMEEDIVENVQFFLEKEREEGGARPSELRFRRYKVNVIIDHHQSEGAPVVVENNPTVSRLLGRVEHEAGFGGAVSTDFTLIRGGALHAANGGYLVLRAHDLANQPPAWEALKRALVGGTVCPDDPAARGGAATRSLDPEPIPIKLKVLLLGPPGHYYMFYANDEDFRNTFKVVADFEERMERNAENELEYATFIATRCHEEGLLHFDRDAVGQVIEQGSRLAGSQSKLSTRFGDISNLIRESSYWADSGDREVVTSEDVLKAVNERIYYRARVETRMRERILKDTLLISTEGSVVGQANSLTSTQVGEHRFGQPMRVTARTYMGRGGVVQIDREVHLAGPIHNKGVMTLIGYLGGTYAIDQPLSFSAQITFEQSYGGIEGDSASAIELIVLISSLSKIPLNQAIALTGSVNQLGKIQAIGGASEKVESWYALCKERGFTGDQGVIIPASNVEDLMLEEDLRASVDKGEFHLWAIEEIDEGLELLMDKPPSEVHEAAHDRLFKLAEGIEKFGKGD
ncbi:MAG: AAA family ATPase [Anaerolineales bacterium]|nr:AAA family ATPase [Anaerolineales bacterium]